MHQCFGNDKGRSVGPKSIAPMLPDSMGMAVDQLHPEMTILNFSEVHPPERFAEKFDGAVGLIDVERYYIETRRPWLIGWSGQNGRGRVYKSQLSRRR